MADEYIRRDFALAGTELYKYGEMEIEAVSAEYIQRLPAADVAEVVHGQWIGEGDGYADGALVCDVWHCSVCDYTIDDGTDNPARLPKYCAGCGAKMDGGNDHVSG